MAYIAFADGTAIPTPKIESGTITIATNVDGARNESGNFVGQVVGDDKLKVELSWAYMTGEDLLAFFQKFDRKKGGKFVNSFVLFDPRTGVLTTLQMYVGDRSATPYMVDSVTGVPEGYINVKANLIEV